MKIKSIALLSIFLFTLIPPTSANAQDIPRTFDNALSLMYFSEAILEDQTDLDQVLSVSGLFAINYDALLADPDNAALAASIHAAKAKRNDLDAKYSLLISQYNNKGKDCEADLLKKKWDQKREQINSEIGRLHKKRGDRRRPLTKFWHRFKRFGRGIWHRIGRHGRNFLRRIGPEALEAVATGGFSGLKTLAKQYIKSISRKKLILHGLERILTGQLQIMQEAGLDICDPEQEEEKTSAEKEKEQTSQDQILKFSLTTEEINFNWNSLLEPEEEGHHCIGLWPDQDDLFEQKTIEIQIDLINKALSTEPIQGNRIIENVVDNSKSLQHQSFSAKISGPYQLSEEVDGRLLLFRGTANLSLTLDGDRDCSFWEVSSSGDPVFFEYTISRIQTIDLNPPYELRIITYDGKTGKATLLIGYDWQGWGENTGFTISTLDYTLSEEEFQALYPNY